MLLDCCGWFGLVGVVRWLILVKWLLMVGVAFATGATRAQIFTKYLLLNVLMR